MNIISTPHNIEWLLDSNEDLPATATIGEAAETKKISFPYPPEMATGFSEHTKTPTGIVVIQDTHHFMPNQCPPSIPIGSFSVEFDEPVLAIHTVHQGEVLVVDRKSGETASRRSGIDGFGQYSEYSVEQTVTTSTSLLTTALLAPVRQLEQLLDRDTVAMVFDRLQISKINTHGLHQIPLTISKRLEHFVDHSLRNPFKALHLQARFLDYLCSLTLHLGSDIVKTQNQNSAQSRAQAVHNFLICVGAETPTLSSLSEKFGASPNRLNAEFMLEFGETIYSFMTNYRLEQARLAIEKGCQPLKVIAYKVGYSHVNHFITAFKRKYNCTPGSLRP